MSVLVDTSVWSLALRRRRKDLSAGEIPIVAGWENLVREGAALLIGPVRQEILSGVPDAAKFHLLKRHLVAFPDIPILREDYEASAESYNVCRKRGVTATGTDLLICSVARRVDIPVFSTDRDFERFARILGVILFRE